MKQFVRAGAHHDPRGIDAVKRTERATQRMAFWIGIACRIARALAIAKASRARLPTGAERILVGRELDQHLPIRAGRLAGHIGMDRCNPRLGLGTNEGALASGCFRGRFRHDDRALAGLPRHGNRLARAAVPQPVSARRTAPFQSLAMANAGIDALPSSPPPMRCGPIGWTPSPLGLCGRPAAAS